MIWAWVWAQTDRYALHFSSALYSVLVPTTFFYFLFYSILRHFFGIFRKIQGFLAIQPTYGTESGESWPAAGKKFRVFLSRSGVYIFVGFQASLISQDSCK